MQFPKQVCRREKRQLRQRFEGWRFVKAVYLSLLKAIGFSMAVGYFVGCSAVPFRDLEILTVFPNPEGP